MKRKLVKSLSALAGAAVGALALTFATPSHTNPR